MAVTDPGYVQSGRSYLEWGPIIGFSKWLNGLQKQSTSGTLAGSARKSFGGHYSMI